MQVIVSIIVALVIPFRNRGPLPKIAAHAHADTLCNIQLTKQCFGIKESRCAHTPFNRCTVLDSGVIHRLNHMPHTQLAQFLLHNRPPVNLIAHPPQSCMYVTYYHERPQLQHLLPRRHPYKHMATEHHRGIYVLADGAAGTAAVRLAALTPLLRPRCRPQRHGRSPRLE